MGSGLAGSDRLNGFLAVSPPLLRGTAGGGMSMGLEEGVVKGGRGEVGTGSGADVFKSLLLGSGGGGCELLA